MPLAPFVEVPLVQRRQDGVVILGPDGKPLPKRDQFGKIVTGIAINPAKQAVKGYWLLPDQVTVLLAAAPGAGQAGAKVDLDFLIDSQGHFDWVYILGTSDAAYTLEFFDIGCSRLLQTRPVHSSNIVGSGVRPFRLPEPYFFNVGDGLRNVRCSVRNLSLSQNNVRLILYGRRFYHKEAPPDVALDMQKKFGSGERTYSYFLMPNEINLDGSANGTAAVVAASGTATLTFEADDTGDVEIQKLMVNRTGTFTFRLRERDTNRYLSNGVLPDVSGFGTAEFPYYFADTFLLERKKHLLMEITDTSGAQNTIYPTLAGRRLHYR